MKKLGKVLAGAAVVAGVIAGPGIAQAVETGDHGPRDATSRPAAADGDGFVYAWVHADFNGGWCKWDGNDTNWGTCPNGTVSNIRNIASSLWNNGHPWGNDQVNFYWGTSYTGAWACLSPGDYWANLTYNTFSWGADRPGFGESANDNISSHKWVDYCGLS